MLSPVLQFQSFFGTFTPQMCETLICGQEHQNMHNIEIPNSFVDHKFGDLFRAMNSRGVSFTI